MLFRSACTIVGAGYFAPKADATPTTGEWIQDMREWKSKQGRTSAEDSINTSLLEYEDMEHGCDDSTEQEELLQFPSDGDQQGS